MTIMKKISFTALFIGITSLVFSQYQAPKVMPPSPEVAALGKYVDIPVGYSSGTPIINIPVYTFKNGNIDVPISLSYNASGIKVEEASTWVGLGWNLNTGGSLSRVIRGGIADEQGSIGYMNAPSNKTIEHIHGIVPDSLEDIDLRQNLIPNGYIDLEPDMFMFNVGGYSGKFYWSQKTNSFLLTPFQNIKIEYTTVPNKITGFIITTPNGVKYYFGLSVDGITTSYELSDGKKLTYYTDGVTSIPTYNNGRLDMNSWSLLDIVEPTGKKISFQYNLVVAKSFGRAGETREFGGIASCHIPQSRVSTFYEQQFYKPTLSKIYSENGSVEFVLDDNVRQDVVKSEKALKQINIVNDSNVIVTSFKLDYSYSISNDPVSLPGLTAYTDIATKRLVLNKFYQVANNGEESKPYEFIYSDIKLPSRLASSQDHWGYFNNKRSYADFLTPKVTPDYALVLTYLNYGAYNYELDADRRIDVNYTQAGILNKIIYPTGGYTQYTYEPNVVPLLQDDVQQKFERSGLKEDSVVLPGTTYANQTNVTLYTSNFTIGNIYAKAKIKVELPWCNSNLTGVCNFKLTIESLSNPQFYLPPIETSTEAYIALPPGNYIMKAKITPPTNGDPIPQLILDEIKLSWKEQEDPYNFIFGGLRTKKIVSYDGLGHTISRSFEYNLFQNNLISSAFIEGFPSYVDVHNTCMDCATNGDWVFGTFGKIFSNSVTPLCGDGKLVRYTNVTEYIDSNKTASKTNYTFSNNYDDYNYNAPNASVRKDWQNNLLVKKEVYEKKSASNFEIKQEDNYVFDYFGAVEDVNMGATYKPIKNTCTDPFRAQFASGSTSYSYIFRSEWYVPTSSTSTTYSYDASGVQKQLTTVVTNAYNDDYLLKETTTTNSKGLTIKNITHYTNDYNNSIPNITALKSKHIIQLPIKQETIVNGNLKAGSIFSYNSAGQPTDVYSYENSNAVPPAIHNANILVPSNYVHKHHLEYNSSHGGDIISQNKANDITESYIYGYNNQYPVAKIVGKSYNDAITQSGIYLTVLNDPNKTEQQIRTELNKLRTLTGALVTTYTYKPLVGVTSETDPQGKTIYYVYDNFNRLKLIKDKDNNILKTFEYKYQEQQ